jgi:hypothetical protein
MLLRLADLGAVYGHHCMDLTPIEGDLLIIIPFTWSGPRGVAGYTEAHACAWHVCQLSLLDP